MPTLDDATIWVCGALLIVVAAIMAPIVIAELSKNRGRKPRLKDQPSFRDPVGKAIYSPRAFRRPKE